MRDWLERHQSWLYLFCILAGLAIGLSQPDMTSRLETVLWPLLGGLLYATFTQVPLIRIGQGLTDWRFLAALLLGNFVVIPLILAAVISGVANLELHRLGQLGGWTVAYYLATSSVAVLIGLAMVNLIRPGTGLARGGGEDTAALRHLSPGPVRGLRRGTCRRPGSAAGPCRRGVGGACGERPGTCLAAASGLAGASGARAAAWLVPCGAGDRGGRAHGRREG